METKNEITSLTGYIVGHFMIICNQNNRQLSPAIEREAGSKFLWECNKYLGIEVQMTTNKRPEESIEE